jgi:hypothetical protein
MEFTLSFQALSRSKHIFLDGILKNKVLESGYFVECHTFIFQRLYFDSYKLYNPIDLFRREEAPL